MDTEIKNRVAASGIISLDLEKLIPIYQIHNFDLKDYLFKGLLLKEKDFRESLANLDWSTFEKSWVAVHCSNDAIVPSWAYMLVAKYLSEVGAMAHFGDHDATEAFICKTALQNLDPNDYLDKRVVVKGCGERKLSESAYLEISLKLIPVVKSLMFGEPCSTVPIYKQKKK